MLKKLSFVFSWVDWVLLFWVLRFLYKGFKNGLQLTLFNTLRMGMILFCCLGYFLYFSHIIHQNTLIPLSYAKPLAFLTLAALTYFGFWVLAKALSFLVKIHFTPIIERGGGVFISFFHYLLVLGFTLFFLMLLPFTFTHEQVYKKSFIGKRVVRVLIKQYGFIMERVPFQIRKPTIQDFSPNSLISRLEQ